MSLSCGISSIMANHSSRFLTFIKVLKYMCCKRFYQQVAVQTSVNLLMSVENANDHIFIIHIKMKLKPKQSSSVSK